MPEPKVTKAELQLLEKLWQFGSATVRDIQESLPEKERPAYTTVLTIISRLEEKGIVRRVMKIGKAHVFEAAVTRKAVHAGAIRELLDLFGGSPAPLVSHLVETGRLTLGDLREVERLLNHLEEKP
jgi:predicted transcriptional regulator